MKPRLKTAPATDDDINIGVWLMARWLVRFGEARLQCELAQDERDADLMSWAQGIRRAHMGLLAEHESLSLPSSDGRRSIDVGGVHWST